MGDSCDKQGGTTSANQMTPENIWKGGCCFLNIQGIQFRVVKKGKYRIRMIFVVSAPVGTPLAGLSTSRPHMRASLIYRSEYRSGLKEGTKEHEAERCIWVFFDELFRNMKLKQDPLPKEKPRICFEERRRQKLRYLPQPGAAPGDKVVYSLGRHVAA